MAGEKTRPGIRGDDTWLSLVPHPLCVDSPSASFPRQSLPEPFH